MKPLTDQARAFQEQFAIWDGLEEEALLARAEEYAQRKRRDEERTAALAKAPPRRTRHPGPKRLPL